MKREREKREERCEIYFFFSRLNEKKKDVFVYFHFHKSFTFHAHAHTHTHAITVKMPVDKQPQKKDKLTDAEKKKLKQENKVYFRILFRGGTRVFFWFRMLCVSFFLIDLSR